MRKVSMNSYEILLGNTANWKKPRSKKDEKI